MRRPLTKPRGLGSAILWDLLTFEKLMTAQVVHLIYWSGLAIIALGIFGTIGAAVGLAIRSADLISVLTAIPVAVGGLLVMAVLCSGLITLLFTVRDRVLSWQKGTVKW